MSCYEWERGTIKLPSSVYSSFRRDIISSWNTYQLQLLDLAKRALPIVKAATKGLTDWEARDAAHRAAAGLTKDSERLLSLITKSGPKGQVFSCPKKKDLPIKPISAGCSLDIEDALISFDDAERSVTWSVDESNHARERAREHPIARKLFSKLSSVKWVRGTGGVIVGNDEYNRDCDYDGGGGNYVTASFGPEYLKSRYGRNARF